MKHLTGNINRRHLLYLLGAGAAGGALCRKVPTAFAAAQPRGTHRRRTIMLDPGHGGLDPGAIGITGVYEKHISLAAAREAARMLEATGRYEVKLTRDDDEFIPLTDRVQRAEAVNADLFLSIHADANHDSHIRGASVFTLSDQASDAGAAALATRENKADRIAGVDISNRDPIVGEILFDLARRQTNNMSLRLASALVDELGRDVPLLNNTHRSAGFVVLKAPDIPSVLVELGVLSNWEEERSLRQPAYQQRLAGSIVRSINDYFEHVS